MSAPSRKTSGIHPTRRLAAAFAVGALWFFAAPWGGNLFLWLGLGYNLALIVLALMDYRCLSDSHHCSISRDCGQILSLGERNPIHLDAVHRGAGPLHVEIRDEPPSELDADPRFVRMRAEPGTSVRMNYKVLPEERGDYRFGDLNVRYSTILGLLARQERIPAETSVKVYPDILQTQKHMLLSRENRVSHMGIRKSRLVGQGREFRRLREYVPDDSPHDIDWKATARKGSLITREYDVEQSQSIMVLLDAGRTMASRTIEADGKPGITKLDCAINASVLLAHVAAQSDDRVGLYCFAQGPIAYLPPGKGAAQSARFLDALYAIKPRIEEPAYFEHFTVLRRRQNKRSLVFVFTDLIDPDASKSLIANISLLTAKHLVVCVALADYELPTIVESAPEKPADLYTQTVALGIIRERKKALAQLASQGVVTIDAVPSDLSVVTVNKYLQLKREARI